MFLTYFPFSGQFWSKRSVRSPVLLGIGNAPSLYLALFRSLRLQPAASLNDDHTEIRLLVPLRSCPLLLPHKAAQSAQNQHREDS